VSWDQRKPDGVGDIEHTRDGFTAPVSIPLNPDGYFGRECPSCHALFKMRHDEYTALPDDLALTCPYCGERRERSEFISTAQRERVTAAARGLAQQMVHAKVNEIFSRSFGQRQQSPRGSFISSETRYTPGSPPPIRDLPEIIEDEVRRIIECSSCGNHHAVFSASAFCPVCGPRPAAEKVVESIEAARQALAVEDHLDAERREQLRATGVFERFAVDATESVVGLFEVFVREQFYARASSPEAAVRGKGNVFQRLGDTAQLFADHTGIDLRALAGPDRWERLQRAFARRHVLVHRGGIVDQRFLDQVPNSGLAVGQRLVIHRADADEAMSDLEAVVHALDRAGVR
jgi:sarcosine oxidase delta subunit